MNYPIIIFKLVHFQSYQFNLSSPYSYSKITDWTSNPEHIIEALDSVERTVHCENNFRLSVLFSFLFASLRYQLEIIMNNLVLFIHHVFLYFREQTARSSLQSGNYVFHAILCYGRSHCSVQWDDATVCFRCISLRPN